MSGARRQLAADRGAFWQDWIDESHLTGEYIVHTQQDCSVILDQARLMRDLHDTPGKELRLAGYVPDIFMDDILRKGRSLCRDAKGLVNGKQLDEYITREIKRFLNDPENKAFRVWEGRL